MRVTVVGSGFVGATAVMRIVQKGLADEVVMIDIIDGLPQGLALDIRESSPVEGFEPNVRGTNDYADTADSDVVVITAGLPRQPGMSRMDLLDKNAGIIRAVVGRVAEHSPGASLIIVTNPLDEMTYLASEVSGFPKERVMGMAGVLDSARLRYFIAEQLGVSPTDVEAMTLGSHGESMVPLPRHATVGGKPLVELVDESTLERLYQRTRGAPTTRLLPRSPRWSTRSPTTPARFSPSAPGARASTESLRSTSACRPGLVGEGSRRSSSSISMRGSWRPCGLRPKASGRSVPTWPASVERRSPHCRHHGISRKNRVVWRSCR